MQLYEATIERGPAKAAASFVTGRAMQRRILAQAMADPAFKTQLFRFVDVYPSIRDSGDLLRHLRSYLGSVDAPRPLDRLVATDRRRLPSWAVTRLTERGMQRMAETLIAGRDATDALPTLKRLRRRHTGFTLDILGEACLSDAESEEYARRYHDLLDYLPAKVARWGDDRAIDQSPYGPEPRVNVSLKVSSLYSQIDPLDFEGSRRALVSALKPLFLKARDNGVFLNIDVERFVHRDLTYAVFADLCRDPELRDYPHLGIVVQAYLRDSAEIVQGLLYLARDRGTPFTVRLVKGAYWDYETILAAQEHWPPPVFLQQGRDRRPVRAAGEDAHRQLAVDPAGPGHPQHPEHRRRDRRGRGGRTARHRGRDPGAARHGRFHPPGGGAARATGCASTCRWES